MKQTAIWENGRKVFDSLTAVVAGILTEIIFDILTEEHFEGTFKNEAIKIFSINEYDFFEKCGLAIGIFLILWVFMSLLFPIIVYVVSSWIPEKRTKISTDIIISTYESFKTELYSLVERAAQENLSQTDYYLLFTDLCKWIVKLYNIFCTGKVENVSSVKAAFRRGGTIYDIGSKISAYEYLKVMDRLKNLLDLIYYTIWSCDSDLLTFDYKESKLLLDKLSSLIGDLGIEN